jgi:predicted enzyme related to lactoylglutathione lyase
MGHPAHHHHINYIEFPATDVARAKQFYSAVFGWEFQDYGPDYTSFNGASAGVDGGFFKTEAHEGPGKSAPLVVLYSADLKAAEAAITAAGGSITVPTFEFPGGCRFHFADGVGNVLAVWSEKA